MPTYVVRSFGHLPTEDAENFVCGSMERATEEAGRRLGKPTSEATEELPLSGEDTSSLIASGCLPPGSRSLKFWKGGWQASTGWVGVFEIAT